MQVDVLGRWGGSAVLPLQKKHDGRCGRKVGTSEWNNRNSEKIEAQKAGRRIPNQIGSVSDA